MEAVQLPDVVAARVEIAGRLAEAERSGWPETTATLLYALAVDTFINFPDDAPTAIATLIDTAEVLGEGGILAAGLCLRAELALRDGDVVRAPCGCQPGRCRPGRRERSLGSGQRPHRRRHCL